MRTREALIDAYAHARDTKSDINEHVPTLRRLAEQCKHVTEFGVRNGISTRAILSAALHGQLERLTSYDKRVTTNVRRELTELALCSFYLHEDSSLEIRIDPTDMLFIDTKHTYEQLFNELLSHCHRVKRWIVLHDTELFAHNDEFAKGEGRGLKPAVDEFLRVHLEWFVSEHYPNNNGLTILSCDQRDNNGKVTTWHK